MCEARATYQFTNDQVRMISGSSVPDPGRHEFELACEIIGRQFELVGAVELFEPCVHALAWRFGWGNVPKVKLNVGSKMDTSILPSNAKRQFRELNEWDLRLYDWVTNDYLPKRLNR